MLKKNNMLILQQIKKDWDSFMNHHFENKDKALLANQNEKNKLKNFMLDVSIDETLSTAEKKHLIQESLVLLSKYSGCAEDLEIAEAILNELYNKGIIDEQDSEIFYRNSPLNRW